MPKPTAVLEGGARGAAWQRRWGELRARRIAAIASVPAGLLAAALLGGPLGWGAAVVLPVVALVRLYAWPCPGCHGRFTGAGVAPMPSACATCGLAAFDEYVAAPVAALSASAWHPPSVRLRRTVAVSQVVGGLLVGLLTVILPFQGYSLTGWYFLMVQGTAFAALASGIWLWQGRPEGLRLARMLLLLQVVKVYSPWLVFDMRAGFGILLQASANGLGIRLDVSGTLLLGRQAGVQPEFTVNVLAVVWLCALLGTRARKAPRSMPSAQPPAPTEPPVAAPTT